MATIRPIDGRAIHQIQSGQVIIDLCSVVKELVENSLDASATSIDVRFKNQGLDSIEVQDNGSGISSQDYETLALKHHTSKLATYADLTTLQTFGFRGEALSSLCAVSRFSITTCLAEDVPKGTKLEFESSGKLRGTSVVAAQRGTTIMVEHLFSNLPVRRQELERNIKREWNRVVTVLGQYACIQTGIKFTLSQQAGKGKKMTLFSTRGNLTTRENIVNVFGAKTMSALITLDLRLELEPTSMPGRKWKAPEDGNTQEIRIVGHISRPAFGEGRQLPDRQMFYVNSRPCGLPQVSKSFNEVYKAYNGAQSPFLFANIILDTHLYDVNVSPDKRTILLHDQSRMLESMKASLAELFESQDYTVPISQIPTHKQALYKQSTFTRENARAPNISQTTEQHSNETESHILTDEKTGRQTSTQPMSNTSAEAFARSARDGEETYLDLISDRVGRKTTEQPTVPTSMSKTVNVASGLFEKWKEKETREPLEGQTIMSDRFSNLDESKEDDQTQGQFSGEESDVAMIDSNKRSIGLTRFATDPGVDFIESASPVPGVTQSPMSTAGKKGEAGFRSRLRGTPATSVEITVGDHQVTRTIGTPSLKRAYTAESPYRPRKILPTALGNTLPSFGGGLSERFSAPRTQQPTSDVEGLDDEVRTEALTQSGEKFDVAPDYEDKDMQASVQVLPEARIEDDFTTQDLATISQDVSKPGPRVEDDGLKETHEDIEVHQMIESEGHAAMGSVEEDTNRTKALLRGGTKRKDNTANLVGILETTVETVSQLSRRSFAMQAKHQGGESVKATDAGIEGANAEEVLSLTISKADFSKMKIVGQFNLGFILATRYSPANEKSQAPMHAADLFIIDQHASDEKYNFERLQASTVVQSQRLVHPKVLDLTAMEEEIVIENQKALESNGFIVKVDQSGESTVGERCQLVSLPLSRETIFSTTDFEELLSLLAEQTGGPVPRPSKVRKMLAMRACRGSIMIGKTLTQTQMEKVVRHMGEIDKPWNCPHGRPTMRHLCGLTVWDDIGWRESDSREGVKADRINWSAYAGQVRDSDVESL